MLQDFSFFLSTHLEVLSILAYLAAYVRVRFHYTKGVWTFEYRMFAAIPSSPFYTVLTLDRIIKRWSILTPGIDTTVFCFLTTILSKATQYLSGNQMISALRRTALLTYPWEISLSLSAHRRHTPYRSLLVSVSSFRDGEEISHQLCSNSDAIKFYIR